MLEEFFISLNTQFQNYYVAKEQLIQKILTIIKK
jgi:hypothetical protein